MMNRNKRIAATGLLILLPVLHACVDSGKVDIHSAAPATDTSAVASLSPSTGTVSPGETFDSSVELRNVGDTFFAAFDILYDPTVVEYVDAREGSFLNQEGTGPTAFRVGPHDEEPGRLKVGLTRLGPIGDVSGSGTLLTLTFKALDYGSTTLAFSNPKGLKTADNLDTVIDTWENGTITVASPPT